MPNPLIPTTWIRFAAVTLLTATPLLCAVADDTKPPTAPEGYKMVPVKMGDKTGYIEVQNQNGSNPIFQQPAPPPGKYDPTWMGATSPVANKSFFTTTAESAQSKTSLYSSDHDSFVTKPFSGPTPSWAQSGKTSKLALPPAPEEAQKTAGFNQTFATSSASLGDKSTSPFATMKSSEQDRTSPLASKTSDVVLNSYAVKPFQGEEADSVRKDLSKTNNGLMQLKDLPNRPLTIDEVRALINHGIKPNTDEPAAEPSKPLNDPDYKPEPLRDTPQPYLNDKDKNEDKDLPLPGPGAMAHPPENADPLPQQ